MDIPVYLFTGFLESGKTKFIQETLEDKRFNGKGERTLLLVCEEGVEEYTPDSFASPNVFLELVEEESDLIRFVSAVVRSPPAEPHRTRAARADAVAPVVRFGEASARPADQRNVRRPHFVDDEFAEPADVRYIGIRAGVDAVVDDAADVLGEHAVQVGRNPADRFRPDQIKFVHVYSSDRVWMTLLSQNLLDKESKLLYTIRQILSFFRSGPC